MNTASVIIEILILVGVSINATVGILNYCLNKKDKQ
jgi:hypothetical protein